MPERNLRSSQVVVPFGVGAIVDFPDESLMTCSIDYWQGGERINDERLQRRLSKFGIRNFRKPPIKDNGGSIPFVRFPKWMFCPQCRKFKPVEQWQQEYKERRSKNFDIPKCSICNSKLVPSRFVIACSHGHIDDFPWIEWVHRNSGICTAPQLKISTGTGSSGLSGIKVECEYCEASETMNRAFAKGELGKIKKCSGNKPWELGKKDDCGLPLTTLQRGGSNVYFPNLISSIYIPEDPVDLVDIIKGTSAWNNIHNTVELEKNENFIEFIARTISDEINQDYDRVLKCLNQMICNNYVKDEEKNEISEIQYRYREYEAFCGMSDIDPSSRDFVIEMIRSEQYGLDYINRIILAHKLREIRVLLSFTRLKPIDSHEDLFDEEQSEVDIKPQLVSNNLHHNGWLPAIESRGEGIFIKFNSKLLNNWASQVGVKRRADIINERYRKVVLERGGKVRRITPKFILLHTFSHLLIRQLSFEAGYSSASLRERIYCNESINQPSMEGILIYTASGDSDGTLGGLVREGRPDYFPSIVQNSIEKAEWCSSDPLCQESSGQGLDALNLSACHACVLLPETSCEERNRFLDRVLLTGKIKNQEIGFFNFIK